MLTLKLFRQSDPFHPLEERRIEDGSLVIGRGTDADWVLEDPGRRLSRRHCEIGLGPQGATLRDLSSNGVFMGPSRERPSPDQTVRLGPTETLRLGDYMLVVEAEAPAQRPVPAARPPAGDDGALFDAFCDGAHLDASAFSDEAPEAVMRKLGAIYRQMVQGLAELMDERTAVKADYRLDRTAVRGSSNNPFRWAGAERVAVDLLRRRDDSFLAGPEAVKASFCDVKKHLLCSVAGLDAALAAVLQALNPEAVEARADSKAFLGRGGAAGAWREYATAYAELAAESADETSGTEGGALRREFRAGYRQRLQELDDADGGSS